MDKKNGDYVSGSKKYIIGTDGYKRDRKAVQKYQQERHERVYTRVTLLIRKDDTKILEKLSSVESKNAYIIELIRKDIADE